MLGIFSDVHGNAEGLSAVLAELLRLKPDKVICLGDIVGYGPDPEWCVDAVQKACHVVLCGNHDVALLAGENEFRQEARAALGYHRHLLMPRMNGSPDDGKRQRRWDFLKQLRHRHVEDDCLFVHGSPRDPTREYLRERDIRWGLTQKVTESFELVKWLAFVGHTHRPGVITEDLKFLNPEQISHTYRAMPGKKAIVNVGSVGQPRNGDPRAVFVTLDGTEVRYHMVPYDVDATIAKMEASGILDPRLFERLRTGM